MKQSDESRDHTFDNSYDRADIPAPPSRESASTDAHNDGNTNAQAATTASRVSQSARTAVKSASAMSRDIELIVCWIGLAAMVILDTLAMTGVLTTDQSSPIAQSWFVPSTYAQWIWVPIYVLMAIWLIRLHNSRKKPRKRVLRVFETRTLVFIISCVLSIAWALFWQFGNYPIGLVCAFLTTCALGFELFLCHRKQQAVWDWMPFALAASWMVLQTVCDLYMTAVHYLAKDGPISSIGQTIWCIVLAIILLAVCAGLRFMKSDWVFGLSMLWGIVAIGVRMMDVSKFVAILLIGLCTLTAIVMYVPWNRTADRLKSLDDNAATKRAAK